MGHLLKITFLGLFSGLAGTGIGGLSAFLISKTSNRIMSTILEFSAGLMTAVVCFELLPEAFSLGGTVFTFLGIITGILTVVAIESFLKKSRSLGKGQNTGLLRAGILMAIAIAMHNFPEGFAVGSGFEASTSLGVTITAVIIIHDIPEGIAMAVPMRAGGFSKFKAFAYTVLSGVPMGLGALLGAVLGSVSDSLTAACLGFAGGAMLYIIYGELVPESKRLYLGRLSSLANVLGILCGIIISVYNT
ncbi:MAG TPA: ZIP family metal transporter [Clostridiales bacterium]|nr:ZIP family metal transporter [Clostridiales bacterium]HOL91662.1 ZIP family metal transporter [Clostridiales bacterium]HPP35645.1 ZIP family metal transporter [Clostridiales bacterium]